LWSTLAETVAGGDPGRNNLAVPDPITGQARNRQVSHWIWQGSVDPVTIDDHTPSLLGYLIRACKILRTCNYYEVGIIM
jgi:hypothetical protein